MTQKQEQQQTLQAMADEATIEDVARLMELQEIIKDAYAELGHLKKKVKGTVARRQARQQEIRHLHQAHDEALRRRTMDTD